MQSNNKKNPKVRVDSLEILLYKIKKLKRGEKRGSLALNGNFLNKNFSNKD
jgi:hypothetical protein